MTQKFPVIALKGDSYEIGFSHGLKCRNLIEKNIKLYSQLFDLKKEKIFDLASHFKKNILNFNKNYSIEIEAIAEGAGVDSEWIYALNARTEIINRSIDECSSVFFKSSAILGQNWDWLQESEDLGIVLNIEYENGLKILTMTEPGIIAKIGLNNHGLGVCLNYLNVSKASKGIPVHILLRRILESKSIEEAISIVDPHSNGTASNVLIADKSGNYVDLELAVDNVFFHHSKENIFIHTNHFLAEGFDSSAEDFAGSISRYNRASVIAKNLSGSSNEDMKLILLDETDKDLPICRKFDLIEDFGNLGTVTTIIMDLKNQVMELTRGNPFENNFENLTLIS